MPMIEKESLLDKLYSLPGQFEQHIEERDYSKAKHCYDTAVSVSVFLELEEEQMKELFGERGERGVIIRQGLFPEDKVQRAYQECIRAGQARENRAYEPVRIKNGA